MSSDSNIKNLSVETVIAAWGIEEPPDNATQEQRGRRRRRCIAEETRESSELLLLSPLPSSVLRVSVARPLVYILLHLLPYLLPSFSQQIVAMAAPAGKLKPLVFPFSVVVF